MLFQLKHERVGARYQRVSAVAILPEFPRSAAGKILKRELRGPYWAGRDLLPNGTDYFGRDRKTVAENEPFTA